MLFERQEYQERCVGNILSVLERLEDDEGRDKSALLKEAVGRLHASQDIPVKVVKDDLRLDILMETGTGKTFTYLKAMYEMNRHYGLSKFLLFVPRLAIRAGVIQNIDLTSGYFFQEYGKRIKKHIYGDKSGLNQVEDYIRNEGEFSVLILTSASITGKTKRSRILTRYNENLFGAESPLSAIKKLNPVIFIDEPHLLKGEGFTAVYNEYFSDSLLLRFGATFPREEENKLSNVAYTLDSITAFRDYLVKRISVSTVADANSAVKFYRSGRRDLPLAVHYFKNGIERKTEIKHGQNIAAITGDKAHNFYSIRVKNGKVVCNDRERELSSESYEISDATMREMIRETITIHFEKEQALFQRGIKTLSLFFIPGIADFRGDNPRVKRIFEEEYKKRRAAVMRKELPDSYRAYLKRDYDQDGALRVHEGYFAGDKGTKEEKENEGIKIILHDKERLLSTREPLRFIFSVWALQEGWDNPNIFTLCKLASSGKETTRRQQVGRGLRLAVDDRGRRQTIKHCRDNESGFYGINTLDVVVSGQEDRFIENIQNEIIGGSLTSARLTRMALQALKLNASQISHFIVWLETAKVISLDEGGEEAWHIHQPVVDFLVEHEADMPENIRDQHGMLVEAFRKSIQPPVASRNRTTDKVGVRGDKFKEFETLWRAITNKAEIVYRNIDEETLIAAVKASFDREPIPPIERKIETKTYDHQKNQVVFKKQRSLGAAAALDAVRYSQFIADFANRETLPFPFCLRLFNALERSKVAANPKRASELVAEAVKEHIHRNVVESVDYEFKGEIAIDARGVFYEDATLKKPKKQIEAARIGKYTDTVAEPKSGYLYDKIVYDSSIERDIVRDDPERIDGDKIVVFAKLPRISIPTPYKSYSPDFAYYIRNQAGKKLFLVVEAKGYGKESDIPEEEAKKIQYGRRFFEALSRTETNAQVVFKNRINKQELSQLLREIGENR